MKQRLFQNFWKHLKGKEKFRTKFLGHSRRIGLLIFHCKSPYVTEVPVGIFSLKCRRCELQNVGENSIFWWWSFRNLWRKKSAHEHYCFSCSVGVLKQEHQDLILQTEGSILFRQRPQVRSPTSSTWPIFWYSTSSVTLTQEYVYRECTANFSHQNIGKKLEICKESIENAGQGHTFCMA